MIINQLLSHDGVTLLMFDSVVASVIVTFQEIPLLTIMDDAFSGYTFQGKTKANSLLSFSANLYYLGVVNL
jgi:hypothetical protein